MPPELQRFLNLHAGWIFALAVLWSIASLAYLLWRRRVHGPHFPDRRDVTILFEEKWTSGRSLKSLLTRLGGANNCLHVTVTEDELWVTPHFPFSAFGGKLDLDHRIARDDIESVAKRRWSIRVDYATPVGEPRSIDLRLRRPQKFLDALQTAAEWVAMSNAATRPATMAVAESPAGSSRFAQT